MSQPPALPDDATPPADAPAAAPPAADALPALAAPAEMAPAACGNKLAELFPALFAGLPFKPIKLRIQLDIQQRAPGVFSKKTLSIFFHRHTTSTAYLKALVHNPQRFDLDGAPAGAVAAEHREAAAAELERRHNLFEARRQAEREAQREAELNARRERDAEFEARRERAALLRAYETTTLTRANFCALKGLAESDLEARLAQARQEREERPPQPPREGARPFARDDRPGRPDRPQRDDARRPRPPQRPTSR